MLCQSVVFTDIRDAWGFQTCRDTFQWLCAGSLRVPEKCYCWTLHVYFWVKSIHSSLFQSLRISNTKPPPHVARVARTWLRTFLITFLKQRIRKHQRPGPFRWGSWATLKHRVASHKKPTQTRETFALFDPKKGKCTQRLYWNAKNLRVAQVDANTKRRLLCSRYPLALAVELRSSGHITAIPNLY